MSYIKVDRKICDWEWFTDGNTLKVWMYLLVNAQYKNTKYKGISLKRGQVVVGRKKLASCLGMSEQQIRTCLERLKKTSEITTKSTNKYTVVTIVKYDFYQSDGDDGNQQGNQQITNKQPTNNHNTRKIRNKERKNDIYNSLPVYDPSNNQKTDQEEKEWLLKAMGRA